MSTTVKIKFDGNLQEGNFSSRVNIFDAGQRLTGKVDIFFAETKRVSGISFQVCGYAKTLWESDSSSATKNNGYENYFSTKQYLVGTEDDVPISIQSGSYSYKFTCVLPEQLPSSFEGTFGHVRYTALVTLERPWAVDETHSESLTVRKPLDLNSEPAILRDPSEVEVFQQLWCGLCTSKAIHIKGMLPRSGFVPGEIIPFKAEINNGSNVDIKQLQIALQCVISYQADNPELGCRQEIKDLVLKICDPVLRSSSVTIQHEFIVPLLPSSSNSTYSKLIQIAYCMRIEAETSFLHKNAYVLFPITIGTIPFLKNSVDNLQNHHQLSPVIENSPEPLPLLESLRNFMSSSPIDVTEL